MHLSSLSSRGQHRSVNMSAFSLIRVIHQMERCAPASGKFFRHTVNQYCNSLWVSYISACVWLQNSWKIFIEWIWTLSGGGILLEEEFGILNCNCWNPADEQEVSQWATVTEIHFQMFFFCCCYIVGILLKRQNYVINVTMGVYKNM